MSNVFALMMLRDDMLLPLEGCLPGRDPRPRHLLTTRHPIPRTLGRRHLPWKGAFEVGSSDVGATSEGRDLDPLATSAPEPAFFLVARAILWQLCHSHSHGRRQLLVLIVSQTVFVGPERAESRS